MNSYRKGFLDFLKFLILYNLFKLAHFKKRLTSSPGSWSKLTHSSSKHRFTSQTKLATLRSKRSLLNISLLKSIGHFSKCNEHSRFCRIQRMVRYPLLIRKVLADLNKSQPCFIKCYGMTFKFKETLNLNEEMFLLYTKLSLIKTKNSLFVNCLLFSLTKLLQLTYY